MKTFFKILVVSLLMLSIEGVKGELHFSSLEAPEITAQVGIIEANEDASVTLDVSQFIITDLDNTTVFTLTVLAGLNYTFNGNSITPAINWNGVLSVPVQVSDGELLSNIFTATITVNPLNDAPVITAQPGVIEVNEDASVTLAVNQFTFSDVDHTTGFTLVVLSGSNYTFSGTTITPASNFAGVLSVPVQVSDGSALSNVFTATITVKPLNDAPVITAQSGVIEMNEDASVTLDVNQFTFSDVDHTTGFTLVVLSGTNYIFSGTTITPASNFTGVLSVPVQVSDGSALSNVFTATITVKPLNDAPVITAQSGVIEVNEDASVTLAVNQFTISDVDQTTGFSLVVLSGSNYTFSGTTITPVANFAGVLSVPVQVSDGSVLSNIFNASITVNPLNDAPVISAQSGAIEVNEDASVTLAVNQFTISDVDQTTGFTLVVLSGSNYTFSGTTITPVANFTGVLSVPVQVSDGSSLSNVFNATITVKPLNDAPVITAQPTAIEVNEDAKVILAVNQFTISDVDQTTGFTLVVLSGSNYTFSGTTITPAANFTGVLSVPVQVSDGSNLSNIFNASITVKPLNDAPVISAQPGVIEVNEDTSVALVVNQFTISDVDHTTGFTLVVLAGSNYTFSSTTITPVANFAGVLSVPVQVSDGSALSNIFTASITVKPLNDAPVITAQPTAIEVNEDVRVILAVNQFTISDVDHTTGFTLVVLTGTNYIFNGTTITPVANFTGVLSVPVQVSDGSALSNVFTATITVKPLNDAPVITAQPGVIEVNEDASVMLAVNQFTISDVDHTTGFTLVVLSGSNYTFSGTTITPVANFTGMLSVPVQVSDGSALSNVFTASVTVKPINDAPLVVDDLFYTAENTSVNVSVLANDNDLADGVNGGINPSSLAITQQPQNGSCVVLANKNIIYTPYVGFFGVDHFVYRVADTGYPLPAIERSANVTIEVTRLSPLAIDDQVSTPEDSPVTIRLLDNDVDSDKNPASVRIVDNPQHGNLTVSVGGVVMYTPVQNYFGNDRFTYTIKDFTNLTSNVANVNVVVTPVNDVPQPHADQAYGYPMLPLVVDVIDNDVDVESELVVLSVVVVQQPAHGRATVNGSGQVVYTGNDQFIGTDSFLYRICDKGGLCGEALVKISVSSGNHPPAVVNDQVSLHEDHSVWIAVLANDVDPENQLSPASLTMIEPPLHGLATVDVNTGRIHYEPDMDYYGSDRLVYKVCDNYFIPLCNSGEVLLTILPDNDVPVGGVDVFDASDGVEYRWNLLENDYDVDDVELIAQSLFLPDASVNATIDRPGWLSFKASLGYYCQTVRMRYKVCDDGGLCDTASLIVNVEALDSDADGIPDAMEGVEDADGDHIPNYLDNDSDGDGIDDSREASLDDMCFAIPIDTDDDSIPNYLDVDSDDDGVPDVVEGDEDCDGDRVVNYLDLLDDCQQRVLVPDTYSPNGDGINDSFVIPIVSEYPQNELLIFNRWGSIVFSELNYQNSWSGRSESGTMGTDQLPEGTYFYVLKLGVTGRMIKGTVYLKK